MKKRVIYILAGLILVAFVLVGVLVKNNKVKGSVQSDAVLDEYKQKVHYKSEYDMMQFLLNSRKAGTVLVNARKDTTAVEEEVQDSTPSKEDITSLMKKDDEATIYNIVKGDNPSYEKKYIPEVSAGIDTDGLQKGIARLDVNYLSQLPELPTGCEITSLTTVLNYLGYPVSKETMADQYLPKANYNEASFWDYFLGDPTSNHAFGCYARPIVQAANRYLGQRKSSYKALNYSGSNFGAFLKEIEAGNPVLIWSTMGLEKPYKTVSWNINGEDIDWIVPEHCVVLIGYNLKNGTVTISDPLRGIVTLDIKMVNLRYWQMAGQAVVLKSLSSNPDTETEKSETQKTDTSTTPQSSDEKSDSKENTVKSKEIKEESSAGVTEFSENTSCTLEETVTQKKLDIIN